MQTQYSRETLQAFTLKLQRLRRAIGAWQCVTTVSCWIFGFHLIDVFIARPKYPAAPLVAWLTAFVAGVGMWRLHRLYALDDAYYDQLKVALAAVARELQLLAEGRQRLYSTEGQDDRQDRGDGSRPTFPAI